MAKLQVYISSEDGQRDKILLIIDKTLALEIQRIPGTGWLHVESPALELGGFYEKIQEVMEEHKFRQVADIDTHLTALRLVLKSHGTPPEFIEKVSEMFDSANEEVAKQLKKLGDSIMDKIVNAAERLASGDNPAEFPEFIDRDAFEKK